MSMFAPVSAPAPVKASTDQQHQRAPVEYGAAVSHREMVKEKLRVDPAAIAHKKRPPHEARSSDPPPERADHRGQYVDIEV